MVVTYKMSALNYAIMSRMLTSEHIALPNILANERLVPEIIQGEVSGESLGKAVMEYFVKPELAGTLVERFTAIHQQLRQGGDAGAAQAVVETIQTQ